MSRCKTDRVGNPVTDTECLASVRLLLLLADASILSPTEAPASSASTLMTCGMVRHCLLPLADVLLSAGSHVYLSTTKLHRAMVMLVTLMAELGTAEGLSARATICSQLNFVTI